LVYLKKKKAENAIIVDIAISLDVDDNSETTIAEKKQRYLPHA
jgi:hypothetical protein